MFAIDIRKEVRDQEVTKWIGIGVEPFQCCLDIPRRGVSTDLLKIVHSNTIPLRPGFNRFRLINGSGLISSGSRSVSVTMAYNVTG